MKINKIIYILIFAFSSMSVNAQLYKAKGLGGTVDEAKKEAVTNAIKFSVGEFIANKEVMDDDNFNQKVVSYSNAYVKRISLISEEKLSDNEYEVEVEVDIESQKIIDALKDLNVKVIENAIDNSTLLEAINHFDKNEMNKSNLEDYKNLVNELLVSPIKERKAILQVETVGKLKSLKPQEGSSLFPLELNIVIYPDKNYIATVRRILEEAKPNGNITKSKTHPLSVLENSADDIVHIFSEINLSDSGKITQKKYRVSNEKYLILQKVLNGLYEDFGKIRLEFLNKDDETIAIIDYCGTNACVNQGKALNYKDGITPLRWDVRGCDKNPSLVLNCNSFSIGQADVIAYFELTREQIVDLKNIRVSFVNIYED